MLAKMNLARAIIVLSLLGSAVGGWLAWDLHTKRVDLEVALEDEVPQMCHDLLVESSKHTRLYKEYQNTGSGPQDNLKSYIVKQAVRENVFLGDVTLSNREDSLGRLNAVDKRVTIQPPPSMKGRGQDRTKIANFLYYLEQDSRRLRVTKVHLEPENRRLEEHEISNDRWLWEAEVTIRQKKSE